MFREGVKVCSRAAYGCLVAVLFLGLLGCESDSSVAGRCLGVHWGVPEFSLIDQDGKTFERRQMEGRLWVVDFFYTTCPGPCPALTSRLSELHRLFASDQRIGFLSISSDPTKDTPEVLKRYADRFKADGRWSFLTGSEADVFRLANEGFKMGIAKIEGTAEPVTHSTKLALVDGAGVVRGFFEGVSDGEGVGKGKRELVSCLRHLLKNQNLK